jgi:hypothetical protein
LQEALEQMKEKMGEAGSDPEVIDRIAEGLESAGPLLIVVAVFFLWLILGAIFATIGGLIGGAAFKVEAAPVEDQLG